MKLTLSPKYALRGWKLLPYALLDITTGESHLITANTFNAIKLALSQKAGTYDDGVITTLIEQSILIEDDRDLFPYQEYKLHPTKYIKSAHWALTNRCNYNCKHCFISAPSVSKEDLSTTSCKKIIDKLYEFGIYNYSITGGEPLCRKDIIEIIQYAKTKNIILTSIFTNGSLLTQDFINTLLGIGIKPTFYMSFDGRTTHDWLRGRTGATETTIHAVKLLKDNNLSVTLTYMIFKKNLGCILEDLDFLAKLGIDNIRFGLISNTGEWSKYGKTETISFNEVLQYIMTILPEIINRKYPFTIDIAGLIYLEKFASRYRIPMDKGYLTNEILRQMPCCICARNTLYINPTGHLTGCELLGELDTEIYQSIITTSANSLFTSTYGYAKLSSRNLDDLFKENSDCADCKYVNFCHGGCRANAYLYSNNYYATDINACTFFKDGYYEQIIRLMDSLNIIHT